MAEGWLRHLAGDRFTAFSAGLRRGVVHPLAIEVMREAGVDISQQFSKDVSALIELQFAYVITVCDRARDSCPIFPGPSIREHWPIEDPATAEGSHAERMRVFRATRDEIAERVREWIRTN